MIIISWNIYYFEPAIIFILQFNEDYYNSAVWHCIELNYISTCKIMNLWKCVKYTEHVHISYWLHKSIINVLFVTDLLP